MRCSPGVALGSMFAIACAILVLSIRVHVVHVCPTRGTDLSSSAEEQETPISLGCPKAPGLVFSPNAANAPGTFVKAWLVTLPKQRKPEPAQEEEPEQEEDRD